MDKIIVSNFVTPYEVTVLLVVYISCCEDADVPIDLLINLISPTLPAYEFNPVLEYLPLSNIVEDLSSPTLDATFCRMSDSNAKELVIKVFATLESIDCIEIIVLLFKTLTNECLVTNFRTIRKSRERPVASIPYKQITKHSFMGQFIEKCYKKFQVGQFSQEEQLIKSIQYYITSFKKTARYREDFATIIDINDYIVLDNNKEKIPSNNILHDLANRQTLTTLTTGNGIVYSTEYYQNLLNWELYKLIRVNENYPAPPGYENQDVTNMILKSATFDDYSRFPILYTLQYFVAIKSDLYQDALDSLHNYSDYMLTQHGDNYFHLSLLCLATFHSHFDDCEAAIHDFIEATKVARENKDTSTLYQIMLWVLFFVEDHPSYADIVGVSFEQIVVYLERSPDTTASYISESTFRWKAFMGIQNGSNMVTLMKDIYKLMIISFQTMSDIDGKFSAFKLLYNAWGTFGSEALSDVYGSFIDSPKSSSTTPTLFDISKQFEENNYESAELVSRSLNLPITSNKRMLGLKLLEIKYDIAQGNYVDALESIKNILYIDKDENTSLSVFWRNCFLKEECRIYLLNKLGSRIYPKIRSMINNALFIQDPKYLAEVFLLFCQVLSEINKDDVIELIKSNHLVTFQYQDLKNSFLKILNSTSVDVK